MSKKTKNIFHLPLSDFSVSWFTGKKFTKLYLNGILVVQAGIRVHFTFEFSLFLRAGV